VTSAAAAANRHHGRSYRLFGGAERIGLFRGFFNRKRERRKAPLVGLDALVYS